LKSVQPVAIQSPTVLGEDPYGSVTPEMFKAKSANAGAPGDGETTEVRRAERIGPLEDPRETPSASLLDAPPPIQF
jgi:hypothetical protein